MRTYTQDELQAVKANLPQDLRDALSSPELMEELRRIVTEKHLHVDEAGDVADTVELTLSGLVKASEFVSRLKELLVNKSEQEISALAEEINRRIFIKIQDSLKNIDYIKPGIKESVIVNDFIAVPTPPVAVMPTVPAMQPPIVPVPVPPVLQPMQSISTGTILEAKSQVLVETNKVASENTHENSDPRLKLVPTDVKQKINSDPYKEQI